MQINQNFFLSQTWVSQTGVRWVGVSPTLKKFPHFPSFLLCSRLFQYLLLAFVHMPHFLPPVTNGWPQSIAMMTPLFFNWRRMRRNFWRSFTVQGELRRGRWWRRNSVVSSIIIFLSVFILALLQRSAEAITFDYNLRIWRFVASKGKKRDEFRDVFQKNGKMWEFCKNWGGLP